MIVAATPRCYADTMSRCRYATLRFFVAPYMPLKHIDDIDCRADYKFAATTLKLSWPRLDIYH